MDAFLDMRGITKSYGPVHANVGIDLTVTAGSIVGLLGENGSGKSTLMKILFGMVRPDQGAIVFKNKELSPGSPREALRAGIAMIHQHFTLVNAMTVADNVMLALGESGFWLNRKGVETRIVALSRSYGLGLDPHAIVQNLPLGMRQRVEIVKALMREASLLVLDEPTSILSPPEVEGLIGVLRKLKADGRAIIFITHKLGEVLSVCDEVVVLRDGKVSGRTAVAGATREGLAHMMVGRTLAEPPRRAERAPGPERLVARALSAKDSSGLPRLKDASFSLRGGEILALAGIDGNGQTELCDTLAGLSPAVSGTITLDGADVTGWSSSRRLTAGLAYIPADRGGTSLVQSMSIADNLALRDVARPPFSRFGWLNANGARALVDERTTRFGVRMAGSEAPIGTLSGGNQQKIVLAREIGRDPGVLIAFQPTWGLDPGATRFVIDTILALRDRGGAILYISSELEEVLSVGDRIGVISEGRIVGITDRGDIDIVRLGLLMAGSAQGHAVSAAA
jgi:general nucleoside transport system ATP-binding protein